MGGSPGGLERAEAPLAFQSALAGILLAAELVIDAAGLRPQPLATTTTIDLLRPIGIHLSRRKTQTSLCICQDADYISAYHQEYGVRQ